MYIETSAPQTSGMLARVKTPLYPAPSTGNCLEFYYNMFGENIDTLTVYQEQEVKVCDVFFLSQNQFSFN